MSHLKNVFRGCIQATGSLTILFSLTSCRDIALSDYPYQRVLVTDFSAPVRSQLPEFKGTPSSLNLKISGTIDKPVLIAVDQLTTGQGRSAVRRDTLPAGTYTNKVYQDDYYSNGPTEMTVTGTTGIRGNLTIEWARR